LHDALGGDDLCRAAVDAAVAAALGYDPAQTFSGGAGNDTILAGGLADAIDGGSGFDAVSYATAAHRRAFAGYRHPRPHANEPAAAAAALLPVTAIPASRC